MPQRPWKKAPSADDRSYPALPPHLSKRPYVLLLSRTIGYRIEMIAKGLLESCQEHNLSLLWKNFRHFDPERLEARPIGILINGAPPSVLRRIRRLGPNVPLVSLLGDTLHLPIPTIIPDPEALAHAVTGHFTEEKIATLVFAAPRKHAAAGSMAKAFVNALKADGAPREFHFFDVHHGHTFWASDREDAQRLVRLFRHSAFPVGLVAFSDQLAANCLACAESAGLRVPQDVAVIGMGDHPPFTNMRLPLSSFRIDFEGIGRLGLEMILERRRHPQMPPSRKERRFIGGDLIVRASSQLKLASDPQVARSLQFIQAHFHEPLSLQKMACSVGMSRSSFSSRFRRALGQSAGQYLLKYRLAAGKSLLSHTRLTVAEVAYRVGFERHSYFTRVFRRAFCVTPTTFRAHLAKRNR